MSDPMTTEQKRVINSIVSINETGKLPTPAAYSTVTVLTDGAGISYGIHQSTDRSDSLDAIVMRYIDLNGPLADRLKPYLPQLEADFSSKVDPKNPPGAVRDLMAILAEAGKDPVMQRAQDDVFYENYWTPAVQKCVAMKLVMPLSYLAVYDTCIHSGPGRVDSLRKVFPQSPPSGGGDEKGWTRAFLIARRNWLANFTSPDAAKQALVRRTAGRVEAILKIVDAGNWALQTPLTYRGVTVP